MAWSNPFATRFVQPGEIPWFASPQTELQDLAARFRELGGRAAIVGPHGSGKSTLLEHLIPIIAQSMPFQTERGSPREFICVRCDPASAECKPVDIAGPVLWLRLRKGSLLRGHLSQASEYFCAGRLLVLDGVEQLSLAQWLWILLMIRRHGMLLLVTSHRAVHGVATLVETKVTVETAEKVTDYLLNQQGSQSWQLETRHELQTRLQRQHGNLREVLMEMYDVYQTRTNSGHRRQK